MLYKLTESLAFKYKKILKCHLKLYSTKRLWNILFFGTDDFSVSSLKCLNTELKSGKCIRNLEVVTSFKSRTNPVYDYARKENLILHKWPLTIDKQFDLGIVVSFGHLIPEEIINKFPNGILNVHASLLPRWRGAAPIVHAIANGDTETGITIMIIRPNKFDIGDIVKQRPLEISNDIKMPELYHKLADLGSEVLLSCIYELPHCITQAIPQPNTGITYASKITPNTSQVRWTEKSAQQIYNLSRALHGLYPLKTTWQNTTIKLHDVTAIKNNLMINGEPGLAVYDKKLDAVCVLCSDGNWIACRSIGVTGKKSMNAADFRNGFMKKHTIIFR